MPWLFEYTDYKGDHATWLPGERTYNNAIRVEKEVFTHFKIKTEQTTNLDNYLKKYAHSYNYDDGFYEIDMGKKMTKVQLVNSLKRTWEIEGTKNSLSGCKPGEKVVK